jgi:fructokinase
MSIITIGEILIDWVCLEPGLKEHKIYDFKMAAGGAPANVAIGLAKLGYPVDFMGGLSEDSFGRWLLDCLKEAGVGTRLVQHIPQACTRHAYVYTDESGNRVLDQITSHRCPDSLFQSCLVNPDELTQASIVYFGSVMQSSLEGAKQLEEILQRFPADVLTIYDPNVRICLWTHQMERLKPCLDHSARQVDILKLSDNELSFFTGETIDETADVAAIEAASQHIFEHYQPALLVVTLGAEGALYISAKGKGFVKGFQVPSVEMIGAGDGFVAGLLGGLYALSQQAGKSAKETVRALTPAETETLLREANAVGALVTTQPGATAGLPTRQQLSDFLLQHQPQTVMT